MLPAKGARRPRRRFGGQRTVFRLSLSCWIPRLLRGCQRVLILQLLLHQAYHLQLLGEPRLLALALCAVVRNDLDSFFQQLTVSFEIGFQQGEPFIDCSQHAKNLYQSFKRVRQAFSIVQDRSGRVTVVSYIISSSVILISTVKQKISSSTPVIIYSEIQQTK